MILLPKNDDNTSYFVHSIQCWMLGSVNNLQSQHVACTYMYAMR